MKTLRVSLATGISWQHAPQVQPVSNKWFPDVTLPTRTYTHCLHHGEQHGVELGLGKLQSSNASPSRQLIIDHADSTVGQYTVHQSAVVDPSDGVANILKRI